MAIAYDTSNRTPFAVTTSQTTSHTCTGSNLVLFVNVSTAGSTDFVTGVTYNGVAMTRLQTDTFATVGTRVYQYYLLNPATGVNNVVVSLSSANVATETISYTGVNQSAPTVFNSQQQVTGSATWAQSLTTVDDNSWVMAYLNDAAGRTPVAGSNTIVRQTGAGQGDHTLDSNSPKTPAGVDTLNVSAWSPVASPAVDSLMTVFSPSATVGTTLTAHRALQGVGL